MPYRKCKRVRGKEREERERERADSEVIARVFFNTSKYYSTVSVIFLFESEAFNYIVHEREGGETALARVGRGEHSTASASLLIEPIWLQCETARFYWAVRCSSEFGVREL